MKTEKFIIKLVILSKAIGPVELEQNIGLKGDRCWAKGNRRGQSSIIEPTSGWMIANEFEAPVELNVALDQLLARTNNVTRNIAMLPECIKQISIISYFVRPPAISLTTDTLVKIAALGAGIDIDLYFLGSQSTGSLDS